VQKLNCNGIEINYKIVRKPIKNLYMRIKDDFVQINCNNFFSKAYIEEFICKHSKKIKNFNTPKKRLLFGKESDFANDALYAKELPKVILPIVEEFSKKMNLYPSRVGFRYNKSRWGSCSYKNSINFNYYLAKLPVDLIEYIVVHELAHIKHKNHSKNFWALVEEYLPDVKQRRKKLREFEKIV